MSQIHDGIAGGSFVEDGTTGSYIMDVVSTDLPIADYKVPIEGLPQFEFIGHGQGSAIIPGSIVWGSQLVKIAPFGAIKIINFSSLRSPGTRLDNDIFPNHVISMPVFTFTTILVKDFVFNRQWNGIGGIFYIPSFPQLERKETSWPHAT